jgi:hypothetical protein
VTWPQSKRPQLQRSPRKGGAHSLNTAAGFLQIGEPMDAKWHELEMITPLNRAKTETLSES